MQSGIYLSQVADILKKTAIFLSEKLAKEIELAKNTTIFSCQWRPAIDLYSLYDWFNQ